MTQEYLEDIQKKAKTRKIKREKLKFKLSLSKKSNKKLKLMKKLKPDAKEVSIYSSDSNS